MSEPVVETALEHFGFNSESAPIHTGYLWKLGRGFVKTWKYRFFVVDGKKVKYYTDDTLTTLKGSFYFNVQSEVKYGPYRHEGRASIVVLESPHDSGIFHTMYLSAASMDDQKKWVQVFSSAIATKFPPILRTEFWPEKFTPTTALGVTFNGLHHTSEVEDGNVVEVDHMTQQPTIYFNAPSVEAAKYYTLLLVDFNGDAKMSPKSAKVSFPSSILWLTCNLRHSTLESILCRHEILPYQPPDLHSVLSVHRVFGILFEQKKEIDTTRAKISISRRDVQISDIVYRMDLTCPVGICGCYVKKSHMTIGTREDDEASPVDELEYEVRRSSSSRPPSLQHSSPHSSSSRNSAIMYRIPEDGELDLDKLLTIGSPTRDGSLGSCVSPSSDSGSFSLSSVGSNRRVSFTSNLSPGIQTMPSNADLLSTDSNGTKLVSVLKSARGRPQRKKTVSFRVEEDRQVVSDAIPDEIAVDLYDFDDQPDYEMEYYTSQASSGNVTKISSVASPVSPSLQSKEALLVDDEASTRTAQTTSPKNDNANKSAASVTSPVEKKSSSLSIDLQAEPNNNNSGGNKLNSPSRTSPANSPMTGKGGSRSNSFILHRTNSTEKSSPIPKNSSVDSFADLSFAEKLTRFGSVEALALFFDVKATSIFSGVTLRKKFSADYFHKNSFVYLDVASLTLRWTKSADMKSNSQKHKFIAFKATSATSSAKAAGNCKGIATHVMRLDRTLTLFLNCGQSLTLEGSVTLMEDWCKVIDGIIKEK